jgi:aryl-alcohol dehydrogenase-like predicted oxidoreductase
MEYTTLGDTGLSVSRICLGCMSFGTGNEWGLEPEESEPIIERAIDLGINFFDTANVYSRGESEQILGNALDGYDRDWTVVATKVFNDMDPENPNAQGLSRKGIEQELENSLDRLGMDTVDLYQTHRWDYDTPIEETLRTLDDAVRRNQVRYIGASSMWAYQFAEALSTSDHLGLERFVSMQNFYNLTYREEEREMLPLCEEKGVGVIPWSPLAGGYLARPHDEIDSTERGEELAETYGGAFGDQHQEINERVQQVAEDHGLSMAQVSLAWLLSKDVVDAPIVGTTSVKHLEDAVEAVEVDLPESDIEFLEEPYRPLGVMGPL